MVCCIDDTLVQGEVGKGGLLQHSFEMACCIEATNDK